MSALRLRMAAVVLLVMPTWWGFSSPADFDDPGSEGGGGGYAFTGSAAEHGRTCAVCHVGAGAATIDVRASDDLFERGYEPGRRYVIEVQLDEVEPSGCSAAGCDHNSFAADIVSAQGNPAGVICHAGLTNTDAACPSTIHDGVTLISSGRAVAGQSLRFPELCSQSPVDGCLDDVAILASGTSEDLRQAILARTRGRTAWRFAWRAPVHGRGAVSLHIGVVDGDGGHRVDPLFADYYGDRVATWARTIPGPGGAASSETASGCQAGPGPSGGALGLMLLALAALRRRFVGVGLVILVLLPSVADAQKSSCDIVTGASCAWNEGCDCDHDGFVRGNGKASKYCHFQVCPIDGDDNDPAVGPVPSEFNQDGDPWNAIVDCDDTDPCIDYQCQQTCSPTPEEDLGPVPDDLGSAEPDAGAAPDVGSEPEGEASMDVAVPAEPRGRAEPVGAELPGDEPAPGAQPHRGSWSPSPEAAAYGQNTVGGGPRPVGDGGCQAAHTSSTSAGGLALLLGALLLGVLVNRRKRLSVSVALIVTLGLLSEGCVMVKPWQRGRLAHPEMQIVADPEEQALREHVFQYREAAAGGFGFGGGGCGCN